MKVSTWTFHSDWNYHLLFPVSERSRCQHINLCYRPVCQLEGFLCTLRKHPQFSALTKSKVLPRPHFCFVAQGQKQIKRTVNECLKAYRVTGTGPHCSTIFFIPVFSTAICNTEVCCNSETKRLAWTCYVCLDKTLQKELLNLVPLSQPKNQGRVLSSTIESGQAAELNFGDEVQHRLQ